MSMWLQVVIAFVLAFIFGSLVEYVVHRLMHGGSCLIIGSAAGVAAMGMEDIKFFWYLKRIAGLALLGFLAGSMVFMLQHHLFS